MKIALRVSIGFRNLNATSLIAFATSIHSKYFLVPGLIAPPVTAAALLAIIDALIDAVNAKVDGGKASTALKNECRDNLIDVLKQLAYYAQGAAGSLPALLATGFDAIAPRGGPITLEKPSIKSITSRMSGQSLVTLVAGRYVRLYEVEVAEVDEQGVRGAFRPAVARTSSRNVPIDGLVPGRFYAYRARAVGGTTIFTDWSDVVTHRAV